MNTVRITTAPAPVLLHAPRAAGDPDIPACRRPRTGALRHSAALVLQAAFATVLAMPAHAQSDVTVAALQFAYSRECNSRLHYGAFASRAERDGHVMAAAAFRTAMVAESVHAALQAEQLERLGVAPRWTVESVVIRATEENLTAAIENEVHEAKRVYRALADQAGPECQYDALAALGYARGAEATHAELFTNVLLAMAAMESAGGLGVAAHAGELPPPGARGAFYVCTNDGRVNAHRPAGRCPACGCSAQKLRAIEYQMPQRTGEPRLAASTNP